MIGVYRRYRDLWSAVRQAPILQQPPDPQFVVEALAAALTITEAASRREDEQRIRAIVREEFARLHADVILARALQGMDES